jgi:hypothetical protein
VRPGLPALAWNPSPPKVQSPPPADAEHRRHRPEEHYNPRDVLYVNRRRLARKPGRRSLREPRHARSLASSGRFLAAVPPRPISPRAAERLEAAPRESSSGSSGLYRPRSGVASRSLWRVVLRPRKRGDERSRPEAGSPSLRSRRRLASSASASSTPCTRCTQSGSPASSPLPGARGSSARRRRPCASAPRPGGSRASSSAAHRCAYRFPPPLPASCWVRPRPTSSAKTVRDLLLHRFLGHGCDSPSAPSAVIKPTELRVGSSLRFVTACDVHVAEAMAELRRASTPPTVRVCAPMWRMRRM